MSVLFIVLPLALLVVLAAKIAFAWAAKRGQFDDLDTPAIRALHEDLEEKPEPPAGSGAHDAGTGARTTAAPERSRRLPPNPSIR